MAESTTTPAPLAPASRDQLASVLDGRLAEVWAELFQVPPEKWHKHIADPTHADAICDRLIHNGHKLVLKGPSKRKGEEAETEK